MRRARPDRLTEQEVAAECEVRALTVRLWIRTGRLKAKKVGRRWRVCRRDLDAFLSERASKEAIVRDPGILEAPEP